MSRASLACAASRSADSVLAAAAVTWLVRSPARDRRSRVSVSAASARATAASRLASAVSAASHAASAALADSTACLCVGERCGDPSWIGCGGLGRCGGCQPACLGEHLRQLGDGGLRPTRRGRCRLGRLTALGVVVPGAALLAAELPWPTALVRRWQRPAVAGALAAPAVARLGAKVGRLKRCCNDAPALSEGQ
jgi:hypothetical protein